MASPAAVLSVLVEADTKTATTQLTAYQRELDKVNVTAKKGIETRLGASYNPEAFRAYEAATRKAMDRAANRAAFKAELGANFSPGGFRAYQRAVDQAAASTTHIKDETGKLRTSIGNLSGPVMGAARSLGEYAKAASAVALAYVSVEGAKNAIETTAQLGEATERLSAATGMDIKTASTWIETMKVRDVGSKAVSMGFITLSRNIRNAEGGSKTAKKAFDQLGISQKSLKGQGTEEVLFRVADGLAKVHQPAQRAALAQQLFGRSTQALLPVLKEGSKGVKETLDRTQSFGAFIPKHNKSIGDAIEAQRGWKLALDGIKISFTTSVLPYLVKGADAILGFIQQMRTGRGAGGEFARIIKTAFGVVKDAVEAVADGIKFLIRHWPEIKAAAAPVIAWLIGAFDTVRDAVVKAWPTIKKIALDIFDAIKTAVTVAFPIVKTIAVDAFNAIKDAVTTAFDTIKSVIGPVINWLKGAWDTLSSALSGTFGPIITAIITGFQQLAPAIGPAIDTAEGIISTIIDVLQPVIDMVGTALPAVFNAAKDIISGVMTEIGTVISTGWQIALAAFQAAWSFIQSVMKTIAGIISGAFQIIKGALELFTGIFTLDFGKMWKGVEDIFGGGVKIIVSVVQGVWGALKAAGKFIMDGLSAAISGGWDTIKNLFSTSIQAALAIITGAWSLMYNAGKFILGGVEAGFQAAASAVLGVIVGFVNDIIDVINWLITKIGMSKIGHVSNPLAGSAGGGGGAASLPGVGGGHPAGFATGGMVTAPGYFAGEEAPRHPEVIIATNPAYRQRNLGLFAQAGHMLGIPGFALGGIIGNALSALPGIGPIANLVSGIVGGGAGISLPKAPHLPAWIAGLPGWILGKVGHWIASQVTGLFGGSSGTSGTGALPHGGAGTNSQNQALGRSMMLAAGWGAGQWPALQSLWNQESGWNANAVNASSGAYGIPQALGHGHPFNLGDAPAQIAWGLNYIRGRYGSPAAAWAHERAFNWYRKGGVHGYATGGISRAAASERHVYGRGFQALAAAAAAAPAAAPAAAASSAANGAAGGGLPSIAAVTGEPNVPGIGGQMPTTPAGIAKLSGYISGLRGHISALEHQFGILDSFYNINTLTFVDPTTGELNVHDINERLSQLDTLIQVRQDIFQTWGQVVAYTQRLVDAYRAIIEKLQTAIKVYKMMIDRARKAIAAINTTGLHGQALKTAQRHKQEWQDAADRLQTLMDADTSDVTKYQGNLSSAVGDLQSGGDDRDSAWISLLQLQSERTSVAGTQAQPVTSGGGGGAAAAPDITGLLQTIATQAQQAYNVSQAQYKVLQTFPPFGGSFAQGGVVPGPVGAARTIVAHGGERVGGTPEVHLHFAPGTDWLREFVQVEIKHSGRRDSRVATRALPGGR